MMVQRPGSGMSRTTSRRSFKRSSLTREPSEPETDEEEEGRAEYAENDHDEDDEEEGEVADNHYADTVYDDAFGEPDGPVGNLIVSDGAKHMRNVYRKWPASSSIVQVDEHQRRYNVEHHQVQVNFYNKAAIASIATSIANMTLNQVTTASVQPSPQSTTATSQAASTVTTLVKPMGTAPVRGPPSSASGSGEQVGMMKQPLFPRQDKDWNQNIRVVSIGIDSWYCDGDVPVGIRFEGRDVVTGQPKLFPCPVSMGTELAFTLTLPNRGQCPNVRKLLFEAKPPNRLNKLFPKWTEADAEVGVKEISVKDSPGKQYLLERPPLLPNGELVPNAPIQCPLGYFRMLVLPQDPNDVPLMMHNSYVIDESKYKRCVEQFKACVSDTRILTSMNDLEVHAYPTAKGVVKCSLVLDVYYTRVS